MGADEALFSTRQWTSRGDADLAIEQFSGWDRYLTLDLASKTDLAALAMTFARRDESGKTLYATFSRCYVNEDAVLESRNASYPGWAAAGWITVTLGNETDFGQIEADVIDLCGRCRVIAAAYDPWAATQMSQRLREQDVPMVEYRATTQNFSEPSKELDAAIRSGRITHDGNRVLAWCIGNMVGHYDARGNVYSRKQRHEQKIDSAVALIMSIGLVLHQAPEPASIYEERGSLVL